VLIDPLAGLAIDHRQLARGQHRHTARQRQPHGLRLTTVSLLAASAEMSVQNIFNSPLNFRSEILASQMYLFVIEAQYHRRLSNV